MIVGGLTFPDAQFVPVLQSVTNAALALPCAAAKPALLILTSARAASALPPLENTSNVLCTYVVGEATASAVRQLYDDRVELRGADCGTAAALVSAVCDDLDEWKATTERPIDVYFVCGAKRMPTVEKQLGQHPRVSLHIHEAYTTTSVTELPPLECADDAWLVFFSPSGVNTVATLLDISADNSKYRFAALGPTSEKALLEKIGRCDAVAKKPTPEQVLKAIMEV
eukprot:TRINITY_DN3408_c0_g1_i1.p1 TRINITY_DN3408_c0_g1~~TRINITY_DN3408_c0_g1_i1.p1  ORF type:complete len:226 (+),score=26.80 TRINITY_DN3408_c0_g1_i1:158-835(+)